MTCPVTNPITSPQAYPIITTIQSNASPNDASWLDLGVGVS